MNNQNEITREIIDIVFGKLPRRFQYPEKAKKICEMRLNGATYEEIGEEVHLTNGRCREYVVKVCRLYRSYYKSIPKKPTNYDRIRAMTVAEMAHFFDKTSVFMCTTEKAIKEWLESEVAE